MFSIPSSTCAVLCCGLLACSRPAPSGSTHGAADSRAQPSLAVTIYEGMCDASGAVAISDNLFAVADDEDNVIRTYDADRGGRPIAEFDLSASLGLTRGAAGARPKRARELDLEAATRIGDVAYWLTSHARNKRGKLKPERFRFFATNIPSQTQPLTLVGVPYEHLLDDLVADPRFARFALRDAAELPPNAAGAVNIEGMTARSDGGVWIGFRNPVPHGKALVFALLNPEAVVRGERARFGDPVTLNLRGLGVRSLSSWRGLYLIIAGHYAGGAAPQLYTWDGRAEPVLAAGVDLRGMNPEAFFTADGRDRVLLLSDDGAREVNGAPCKEARHVDRQFRGAWVSVGTHR